MATMPTPDDAKRSGRHAWLVALLALLPFAVKIGVMASGATGYAWQSAYKLAQLAVPVVWRRRVDRKGLLASFWPIDEPLPCLATWAMAVAVAAILAGSGIASVLILAPLLKLDPQSVRAGLDARFAMTPAKAIGVVVYLLTINAALEELHFRAWLDRELSLRWGAVIGIVVSAAAFAGMHVFIFTGIPGASLVVLALVSLALWLAGVAWSLIARRPGGIHAAWLSHGLTDAGLLTWGLFWLGYF